MNFNVHTPFTISSIVSSYFRPVGIPTGTLFRVYYKILDFAMQPTILAWAATCVQVS
jgi:hypothetical protein